MIIDHYIIILTETFFDSTPRGPEQVTVATVRNSVNRLPSVAGARQRQYCVPITL